MTSEGDVELFARSLEDSFMGMAEFVVGFINVCGPLGRVSVCFRVSKVDTCPRIEP